MAGQIAVAEQYSSARHSCLIVMEGTHVCAGVVSGFRFYGLCISGQEEMQAALFRA